MTILTLIITLAATRFLELWPLTLIAAGLYELYLWSISEDSSPGESR
jgi:hypothetical protein